MDRREFLKKAGLAGLGTAAVFVAPSFTTVKARAAYEAVTQVAQTQITQTTTTEPTSTPQPTSTPATNPGVKSGDVEIGPPTESYYTWNTDGCYYQNHYGERRLLVCSPGGPGTYVFPDGWVHP